ncbi:FMN-dependent alpha-hydroxy acid dehydrogenase [Wallemia mellicola]|uniref:FMN-dependent alpha-hydroxy acid dehydrogenase n=1 Tax=Wallemia mellicola TaxID=1708541 RepID=A0A4T0R562_9BASI|nr:FMN-dependent alpha-hydroxy acid dehydrogenase [Wallemia mellicola]
MDPYNKPQGPSPHYSLYQRELFANGPEGKLPSISSHPEKLQHDARKNLTDKGYWYSSSNAGLGWTHHANREAFYKHKIIPKTLQDTNTRDLTTEIFGHKIPAPIMFAPIGINKIYHPKGELAAATVAGELGLPYCLSTAASYSIEEVAEAHEKSTSKKNESNSVNSYSGSKRELETSGPRFFQLYASQDSDVTESLLRRAWASGFDSVMITTDTPQLGLRMTDTDIANYAFYYGDLGNEMGLSDPVFMKKYGDDLKKDSSRWIDHSVWHGKPLTWEKVKDICKFWHELSGGRPFVLKGIQSVEDAETALSIGCDGIVVTNHAGRQVEGAVSSLEVLPDIAKAVGDKCTILFDSGIRTGSDIMKAIALGAHAVMIGRMWVWGLSAGEAGCRHVVRSLLADLDINMTVSGYRSLRDLKPTMLKYDPNGQLPAGRMSEHNLLFYAYAALGVQAVGSVYTGSWGALKTPKATKKAIREAKGEEEDDEDEKDEEVAEKLNAGDAKMFPIIGSAVLGSLFLIVKYVSKEYLNLLLGCYFSLIGGFAGAKYLDSAFYNLIGTSLYNKLFPKWRLLLVKGKEEEARFPFTASSIGFLVVSLAASLSYLYFERPWYLNNFLGLSFAWTGIKLIELDSLKTGAILLSGLFFYDIFWVFFTPVMVSVAKGLDAPIKLLWPKDAGLSFIAELAQKAGYECECLSKYLSGDAPGFTLLGLGDIVLPGVFVALCLRLDLHLATVRHHQQQKQGFPPTASDKFCKPYFTTCLVAYFLGLLTTVVVMHNFKAAQPALLYLSPACIGSVAIASYIRGEFKEVWTWTAEEDKEDKAEDKKSK